MIHCRWCGRNSTDEHICSWCQKELKPTDEIKPDVMLQEHHLFQGDPDLLPDDPTMTELPSTEPAHGSHLSHDVVHDPDLLPMQPTPDPPTATVGPDPFKPTAPAHAPTMRQDPMKPAQPPLQRTTAPATAQPTRTPAPAPSGPIPQHNTVGQLASAAPRHYALPDDEPWGMRLERFLALGMPMLLLACLAAVRFRDTPSSMIFVQTALFFVSGIALPAFRVVGFFDDEYRDVLGALLITMVLGPLLGAIAYLIVFGGLSTILQLDYSKSVLGLMGWMAFANTILVLAMIGLGGTTGAEKAVFGLVAVLLNIQCFNLTNLPFLAIWAGWFFGGFFRPLNRN